MSENQTDTATQTEEQPIVYTANVEDAGPSTKKITIEIPEDYIQGRLAEQFKSLRGEAAIPGFRKGHAPQKLIERRFGGDVRNDLVRSLVADSYEKVVEERKLNVLSQPKFDNPDGLKLPDSGPLSFTFQVEVRPEFNLPELKGIPVKKPNLDVTDEHVNRAMNNLLEQMGTPVAVTDRGVAANDHVTAEVVISCEGKEIARQDSAQVIVRPSRIAGLEVEDLDRQLADANVGQTRTVTVTAPPDHPNADLRSKPVQIDFIIKTIVKMEVPKLDQALLTSLGFSAESELRAELRGQLSGRLARDVRRSMYDQITKYLMDNTTLELPVSLSAEQAERLVQQRTVELMMRGVAADQLSGHIERLRATAQQEAVLEMKRFFILQKLAEVVGVEVEEEELNNRIAELAVSRGTRPERLKAEMAKDGQLKSMYIAIRDEKALEKVVADAQIEETSPAPAPETPASESSAT